MQNTVHFPVHAGAEHVTTLPQTSNFGLSSPTTVPTGLDAHSHFSVPEGDISGQNACKIPVSAELCVPAEKNFIQSAPQILNTTSRSSTPSSSLPAAFSNFSPLEGDYFGQKTCKNCAFPVLQAPAVGNQVQQLPYLPCNATNRSAEVVVAQNRISSEISKSASFLQNLQHTASASLSMVDLVSTTSNTTPNLPLNPHFSVSLNAGDIQEKNGVFSFQEQANKQQPSIVNPHFIEPNNGGNFVQNHSENTPTFSNSQTTVLSSGFTVHKSCQQAKVCLPALCTDAVTVQSSPVVLDLPAPSLSQGSRSVIPSTNIQPFSHINTLPFASSFSVSTSRHPVTLPTTSVDTFPPISFCSTSPSTSQPPSSNPTNANFASLFKNSSETSPILLALIPAHYTTGNLPAIKLDESIYQKSVQTCNLNLTGRFTLPKGSSPVKTSVMLSKLNAKWNISNGFILTPIGRGFFCLRFKNQEDQNQAWLKGSLNLNPGSFRLQPWQKDFKPELQKQTTVTMWIRFHGITQEY